MYLQTSPKQIFPLLIKVFESLNSISKKLGISVKVQTAPDRLIETSELATEKSNNNNTSRIFHWGQDNKIFLKPKNLFLCYEEAPIGIEKETEEIKKVLVEEKKWASGLAHKLILNTKYGKLRLQGGNVYLGRDKNGKPYAIIGSDCLENTVAKNFKDDTSSLAVKKARNLLMDGLEVENMAVVRNTNAYYHIDLLLRPLEKGKVLLTDFDLTYKMIREKANLLKAKNHDSEAKIFYDLATKIENEKNEDKRHVPVEKIEKKLKKKGLEPVRIAGDTGKSGYNFMNAVVHKKENGELAYIVGDSDITLEKYYEHNKEDLPPHLQEYKNQTLNEILKSKGIETINESFERELKEKAPEIAEVHYVEGIGEIYRAHKGGLHCLVSEEPYFKEPK